MLASLNKSLSGFMAHLSCTSMNVIIYTVCIYIYRTQIRFGFSETQTNFEGLNFSAAALKIIDFKHINGWNLEYKIFYSPLPCFFVKCFHYEGL